jgi:hypothetical protein
MASSGDIALPVGTLTETPRGVRIVMPQRAHASVQAILDRLGRVAEWFWLPTTVDEGDALVLDYAHDGAPSLPFAAALVRMEQQPAVHLPELVVLGAYLHACVRALAEVEVKALVAPACLRYQPDRSPAWRLMVVPAGDATLDDWANASAGAWAWTHPQVLLGGAPPKPSSYSIGCALANGLCGDLFPPGVRAGARFKRALRGWVGQPGKLATTVRAALPSSFDDEAKALIQMIETMLDPDRRVDLREPYVELAGKLAPHRTAIRWEYEGRVDIARAILERIAASAPKADVPWEVLTRLREGADDLEGALQAAIDALGTDGDAVRDLAAVTRRIAFALPPERHRGMVERAMSAVDRLGPRLGDAGRLHFAHIEARYLERFTQAMSRLAEPAKSPWDNVLRDTLLARVHAARSEWAHVARLCKQAKAATRGMENAGGELGAYVIAYLEYLDGVAHHGAVSVYRDPGYLADAFTRLVACLDGARGVCSPEDQLITSAIDWLHALAQLAATLDVPAAVRTGITAYLVTLGVRRAPWNGQPAIVWYDAGRLLALSGVPEGV